MQIPFRPGIPCPQPPADDRLDQALAWASAKLDEPIDAGVPVSGDASFRRYFRIGTRQGPLILMDAPPAAEDSRPFLDVAERLRNAGLGAPRVLHFDLDLGLGLIEDLGDRLVRDALSPATADRLMPILFDTLSRMASAVGHTGLPAYDDALLQQELDLFPDWYLERHRQRTLTPAERQTWDSACAVLRKSAGEQPRAFVHRDFHSCNLLLREGRDPGIIDFQDAVSGPLSYDFASLVWDRYIPWPRSRIEAWTDAVRLRLDPRLDADCWQRWCDLMGVQRNLKIVGIFARLRHRDGRDGYVEMIPRFYDYLREVLPAYPELADLARLLEDPSCAP